MSGNFQLYTVHCGDTSYRLLICYFLTKTVVFVLTAAHLESTSSPHFLSLFVKNSWNLLCCFFLLLFAFFFQGLWSLSNACTIQGLARIWAEFICRFWGSPLCFPFLCDIPLTFQPFWQIWTTPSDSLSQQDYDFQPEFYYPNLEEWGRSSSKKAYKCESHPMRFSSFNFPPVSACFWCFPLPLNSCSYILYRVYNFMYGKVSLIQVILQLL